VTDPRVTVTVTVLCVIITNKKVVASAGGMEKEMKRRKTLSAALQGIWLFSKKKCWQRVYLCFNEITNQN
jgi:hypothetical protein